MKRLLPLAAIETFVWIALLVCVMLIGRIIFEISVGPTLVERILTQFIRLGISVGAILIWFVSWKKITERYFWRTIRRSSNST